MIVELLIGDVRYPLTPREPMDRESFASTACSCPSCGYTLDVRGKARRMVGDVHVSDAYCVRCHDLVGVVEARAEIVRGAA